MLKKLINIFLILTLAIQVLPVQQMGAALFNNVFTEEIPHSIDHGPDAVKKITAKSEFIDWAFTPNNFVLLSKPSPNGLLMVTIPHNHTAEILVPPPNC